MALYSRDPLLHRIAPEVHHVRVVDIGYCGQRNLRHHKNNEQYIRLVAESSAHVPNESLLRGGKRSHTSSFFYFISLIFYFNSLIKRHHHE